MASTYLTRTPSSAGNGNTWTFSTWVKRSGLSTTQFLIGSSTSSSDFEDIRFNANTGDLSYNKYVSTKQWGFDSNTYLRDVNGWYHVVVNRSGTTMNYYLNGVAQTRINEVTSTSTGDFNTTDELRIGSRPDSSLYFDGSMSHVHWIDGTAYDASAFGQYDANGVWTIKTSPSVTYGTNGFFILKDGNSVTDQSGNGNNFTVAGGTLTNTEDNPSNVFATLNPLINVPNQTYANGNTKCTDNDGSHKSNYATLGFSSGKYYWEAKAVGGTKYTIGLSDAENQSAYQQVTATNLIVGNSANSYLQGDAIGWYFDTLNKNGSAVASGIHTIVTNDIMMIACDADNGKIYYGVNGTWRVANSTTFNSADNDTTFTTGKAYTPAFSAENCGWETNFGNGYFGTTAVASAGTNASGIGIFEYDVPTGYTALSTKGLNL